MLKVGGSEFGSSSGLNLATGYNRDKPFGNVTGVGSNYGTAEKTTPLGFLNIPGTSNTNHSHTILGGDPSTYTPAHLRDKHWIDTNHSNNLVMRIR